MSDKTKNIKENIEQGKVIKGINTLQSTLAVGTGIEQRLETTAKAMKSAGVYSKNALIVGNDTDEVIDIKATSATVLAGKGDNHYMWNIDNKIIQANNNFMTIEGSVWKA